jgi:hypothetical protein
MAYVLIFALQCLFPIFEAEADEFVGVSIVNTDTQTREFTVTATSPEGTNSKSSRLTLNAGSQHTALLKEILGTTTGFSSGWIRIDSALNACTSYVTSGTDQSLTGTEAMKAAPAALVILPHVSVNTGFAELNHIDTRIAVVNPSNASTEITARLIGLDGGLRGIFRFVIPASGSRVARVSEIFQSSLPNNNLGGKTFSGYVHLESSTPIAAWQRIETPLSRSLLRGRTLEEPQLTSEATIPHFAFGGGYDSFINLVNMPSTPLSIEITAHDDKGQRLGDAVKIALIPGMALRASVPDLFRIPVIAIFPPTLIAGFIRIRESQGQRFQILGDVEIINSNGGPLSASMLIPVSDTASKAWMMPFAVSSAGYFTGYAIVNPNELLAVQTDVQVEVVNPDGTLRNRSSIQLSPSNRVAAVLPTGVRSGYLRISSNLPIHVGGSIGTQDLRQLDQLPAIRQ